MIGMIFIGIAILNLLCIIYTCYVEKPINDYITHEIGNNNVRV